jgi:hypothetical protein
MSGLVRWSWWALAFLNGVSCKPSREGRSQDAGNVFSLKEGEYTFTSAKADKSLTLQAQGGTGRRVSVRKKEGSAGAFLLSQVGKYELRAPELELVSQVDCTVAQDVSAIEVYSVVDGKGRIRLVSFQEGCQFEPPLPEKAIRSAKPLELRPLPGGGFVLVSEVVMKGEKKLLEETYQPSAL